MTNFSVVIVEGCAALISIAGQHFVYIFHYLNSHMSSFSTLWLLAQATATNSAADVAEQADSGLMKGLGMLAIIVVVFVLPFVLGRLLAKRLKMPTYGSSIGTVLATTIGAIMVLALGTLRYGPDIAGGTNLVYEMDKEALKEVSTESGSGQIVRVTAKDLMKPLNERLNPAGTKELLIRPNGDDQIEIIVPQVDQLEVQDIKRIISEAGILEFRILANANDHSDIIDLARKQAAMDIEIDRMSREVLNDDGEVVGIWRPVGRDKEVREGVRALKTDIGDGLARDASTGRLLPIYTGKNGKYEFEKWLVKQGIPEVEVLLALERNGEKFPVVTGSDIANARVSPSSNGGYEVQFSMRSSGAAKLSKLTLRNQPDPKTDFHRRMPILLDGVLLSAPALNQPISSSGMITGNFTRDEAEFLQKILQSGSLPAALNKSPVSENQVGAAMGRDAINKGFLAAFMALIVTAVFMLVYYRFSGIVACVALSINLLLVIAFMIIIRQPITLSGLAGLVLSVGMSVDANVLVFERIREEIAKRSTGRLAIRNGFDRALSTIIDANLTTLISALVLYWVGTDQVRGFAITLIIGLGASMFTAVFCSRIIFEICERWRLVSFSMSDVVGFMRNSFLGQADIDFMSFRKICYAISFVAVLVGLIMPMFRGRQMLDIDFNGGTSVIFVLDQAMTADNVRDLTNKLFEKDANELPIQTTLTNVKMQEFQPDTVYKLDTSLRDVSEVTSRLVDGFNKSSNKAKLLTYEVSANIKPGSASSGSTRPATRIRLVAFQDAEAEAVDTAETAAPPAAADNAVEVATSDQESPAAETAATPADVNAETTQTTLERTTIELKFLAEGGQEAAKINASGLMDKLIVAASDSGFKLNPAQIRIQPVDAKGWTADSDVGYVEWIVRLPLDAEQSAKIVDAFKAHLAEEPIWQSVSKIDSRVAGEMQMRAILALLLSMVFILLYIWFRFQKVAFGLAALIALVHDVVITLGFVALSHWLFKPLGFLLIEDFKISLNMIAAFLTIIGYSLNDTIVVFDRIREVKGKAPRLTSEMINQSINQTLSRTLLTSATTILAILLLYAFGGEAVHAFSFTLLIGILVGTYSSIFVAAPILLWFSEREEAKRELKAA